MATPTARMFPPGDGRHATTRMPRGNSYTTTLGGYADVPTFDASILQANGWTRVGADALVGPTSARPTAAPSGHPIADGMLFLDTTLQVPVVWQRTTGFGGTWRNVFTGAVA